MQAFSQPKATTCFLPSWSLEELQTLRQHSFPDVADTQLEHLVARWGGNPGRVLVHAGDSEAGYNKAVEDIGLNVLRREARIWTSGICIHDRPELQEAERRTPEADEVSSAVSYSQ